MTIVAADGVTLAFVDDEFLRALSLSTSSSLNSIGDSSSSSPPWISTGHLMMRDSGMQRELLLELVELGLVVVAGHVHEPHLERGSRHVHARSCPARANEGHRHAPDPVAERRRRLQREKGAEANAPEHNAVLVDMRVLGQPS